MFKFEVTAKCEDSSARTGTFETPHGSIETPIFMPVGTRGTVKTLDQRDLQDMNAQIILGNTYHLYLRPGADLIAEMGGLHKWMNWDRPILTDSGGYQVFSLGSKEGNGPRKRPGVRITDDGVEFRSYIDGSKHFFSPEGAIQIQHQIGADIIMAFDECAPKTSTKAYFKEAMARTHRWLERCKQAHTNSEQQALFGIVQGGMHTDLRAKSAQFVNNLDLPGNAIGGLSVGEKKTVMHEMIEATVPHLAENKPRYLMGVGTPEDLLEGVERGIDMFDCVHPTRLARHGGFWTLDGRQTITNQHFRRDPDPLSPGCTCHACQNHSRSYIHHLVREGEQLGPRLMSIHNLHFLLDLMQQVRESIRNNCFPSFKSDFLARYGQVRKNSTAD